MQLQISWSIIKEIHVQYLWLCMHYFKFFEDKKPYQCDLCDYNSIYTRTFKIHHACFTCASSDFFRKSFKAAYDTSKAWRMQICSVGNDALFAKSHNIIIT